FFAAKKCWLAFTTLRRKRAAVAKFVGCGLLGVALSGCTSLEEYVHNGFKVGPAYVQPPAPTAPDWIDAADQRVRKESGDLSRWWCVFGDATLDSLISDAYRQNISLRQAGFQILQARAERDIAVGTFF